MAGAPRLVQAASAAQHQVGTRHQARLALGDIGGREGEIGELVHAVIDGEIGLQAGAERQHHRGIVPEDQRPPVPCDLGLEQRA